MKPCRWDFISDNRAGFGVQWICRVPRVSRSGFYRWLAGAGAREERRAAADALAGEIREIHTGHKERTVSAASMRSCAASGR